MIIKNNIVKTIPKDMTYNQMRSLYDNLGVTFDLENNKMILMEIYQEIKE